MVVARGWGRRNGEMFLADNGVSVWKEEKVPKMDSTGGCRAM